MGIVGDAPYASNKFNMERTVVCVTRTDTELLEAKIAQSGKKKTFLAEKVGLSLTGFRNCCINKAEFKGGQIQILCKELNITSLREKEAIFFAQDDA